MAIIQARMASSRLPGKVLADVVGKPLLVHVIERARRAHLVDVVTVATSSRELDDPVARLCGSMNVPCFRGSEQDVLDRYYQAAVCFEADVTVRLTADCPLIDPRVVDKVVHVFHSNSYDYVSNTLQPTYPDGLDAEVIQHAALERAWREALAPSEREHVTPYIWTRAQIFRLANVAHDHDLSSLRWTVDEAADLEFVRRVYSEFRSTPDFGLTELLALLLRRPELQEGNAGIRRNEGYKKSLAAEGSGANP